MMVLFRNIFCSENFIMPRLANVISTILERSLLGNLSLNIDNDSAFRLFLYGAGKLPNANRLASSYKNLDSIARGGYKPTRAEMDRLIDSLTAAFNYFANPPFGYANNSQIVYEDRTISEYAGLRDNPEPMALIQELRQACEQCQNSFHVYAAYPFIDRTHKAPAQGASLAGDPTYDSISALSGDALKTAILELMYDRISQATPENFAGIRSEILGSQAYRILAASQSMMNTYSLFHSGKTRSQTLIDNYLEQRGAELQNSLELSA
ncbi:hypothetical protein [Legionella sp. CNM-4043-24]|uniref:hypothetical protein n=1 Tax=Legionella sp. CNM-4043-24 TaxID=3421646 RepID=UPI00403B3660